MTDRGGLTDDAERRLLGQRTRALLDLFGIPWWAARWAAEDENAARLLTARCAQERPAGLEADRRANA